jgi:branched-chain amino acid transport system permease protein
VMLWRRDAARTMPSGYGDNLGLFRTGGRKLAVGLGLLLYLAVPYGLSWIGLGSDGDTARAHVPNGFLPGLPLGPGWMNIACQAGYLAVGGIGLNLLIGNTGQVSLGHSAFLAIGTFTMTVLANGLLNNEGIAQGRWVPHGVLWLIIATLVGALVSAAVGPFALRLRGNYLAMVSLFLVFFAEHLVKNWSALSGGAGAPRTDIPKLGITFWKDKGLYPAEGQDSEIFGFFKFSKEQLYFWIIWACVAVSALIAVNLLRTRQGRAMMAVRDRDLSSEVIGVRQMYTKTMAFAVAGGLGSLAGALRGSFDGFANPERFALPFSILFVAVIIIGGVGSVSGSILGAIAVAGLPQILEDLKPQLVKIPFVEANPAKPGLTLENLRNLVYGLVIVLFLIYFPEGLAGVWRKAKRYFQTWPFGA